MLFRSVPVCRTAVPLLSPPVGFRPCSTTVVSDRRGLPYSEGVVVKDNNELSVAAWYQVKQSDLAGLVELVKVLPGNGGKFATSAGGIERT